ncbi:DUF2167 domain-containing protein [Mesorhizobium sp. WSM3860]|uniref:DUF2167 domain-containing protein n=1 Tax=Mesorhizobium sp. WSM3860 TaxID=2029403 RepID=UPI000BAEA5EB|nr:DUF2167 domain-containing protein [Mesorhizobium sp. WSM3860]PBC02383.1 hypothetical protein CK220_21710 [Mesorhizobium sp. WSM3860]
MYKSIRENLRFILLAQAFMLAEPAIVHAGDADYHPQNFTQPLNAARGTINPAGGGAIYLKPEDRCNLVVKEFGWDRDQCGTIDQLIFGFTPEIDNLTVEQPVSDGYVSLADWDSAGRGEEISAIEESFKESVKAQSERIGQEIRLDGWLVYPQVDKARNILYYANILNWGGDRTINISVSIFDRQGYVPMKIVPVDGNIAANSVLKIVEASAAAYKPKAGSSYFEHSSGDKVAGYGALGVLAAMLGVKFGKAAGVGLIALALVVLKKGAFLLLLPLVWLRRLFSRNKAGS